MPFTVILGDEEYLDGEIQTSQIFDYVTKTGILPKTSAINEQQYTEYFDELLKEYDAVLHIPLSGGISSACSNAITAASHYNNVEIVDSKSLSTGIALLAIYATKLRDRGIDLKTMKEMVEKRVPYVQASFLIERLDYLYKGGRCNSLALLGANILRLRPQIIVKDGKMISGKKFTGKYSACLMKYFDTTLKEFDNPDYDTVFVTYTTADPVIVEDMKQKLKELGFKNIYNTSAGCTITSHCGENTLGVLFINDGGENA